MIKAVKNNELTEITNNRPTLKHTTIVHLLLLSLFLF